MNQKYEDFKYLVEQACSPLSLSHQSVKENFKYFPVCYMQDRKDGMHSDSVEVSFDRIGASITCSIDEKDICTLSSIYFYDEKDGDLFVNYLVKTADCYDYMKNHWVIKNRFFLTVEKQEHSIDFICRKFSR